MLRKSTTPNHAARNAALIATLLSAALSVPIAAAQTTALLQTPILEMTGSISGIVRDSSSAEIPGVTVQAIHVQTRVIQTQLTDETGSFSFSRVTAGEYSVTASLTGFGPAQATGIQVQECEAVRKDMTLQVAATRPPARAGASIINLPPIRTESINKTQGTFGSFSGRVCSPVSGWIKGAIVSVVKISPNVGTAQPTPSPKIDATADENGGFWIYGLPVGTYSYTVTAPGFETVTDSIRIHAVTSIRDIYLKRPAQTR